MPLKRRVFTRNNRKRRLLSMHLLTSFNLLGDKRDQKERKKILPPHQHLQQLFSLFPFFLYIPLIAREIILFICLKIKSLGLLYLLPFVYIVSTKKKWLVLLSVAWKYYIVLYWIKVCLLILSITIALIYTCNTARYLFHCKHFFFVK